MGHNKEIDVFELYESEWDYKFFTNQTIERISVLLVEHSNSIDIDEIFNNFRLTVKFCCEQYPCNESDYDCNILLITEIEEGKKDRTGYSQKRLTQSRSQFYNEIHNAIWDIWLDFNDTKTYIQWWREKRYEIYYKIEETKEWDQKNELQKTLQLLNDEINNTVLIKLYIKLREKWYSHRDLRA